MSGNAQSPVATLILAGGRSSRMGMPKPNVTLREGRTMLAHVLDAVRMLEIPVHLSVESGATGNAAAPGVPVIPDREDYCGPLVAIAHALDHLAVGRLLVVCCDQPLLQCGLLRQLVDQSREHPTFFRDDNGMEHTPFPGVFPIDSHAAMKAAIARGEKSPRRFAASVECEWVTINAEEAMTLRSFNSRAQLIEAGLLDTEHAR